VTHIKFDQTQVDDDRWIEAGADAFALHAAAMVYSDRQLLDGFIGRAMALRVSLAVPPERAPAAVDALVAAEFWVPEGNGYRIQRFHDHALPADQVARTRERWRVDKERKRQHNAGDHALCKDPKFCPAIRVESTSDSTVDSTSGGSHSYPTQQDQTRPDRRSGYGDGRANGPTTADAEPAAAKEQAPARIGQMPPARHLPEPHPLGADCCALPDIHPVHLRRSAS
jgi:hypothetical protein